MRVCVYVLVSVWLIVVMYCRKKGEGIIILLVCVYISVYVCVCGV